jgi:hypothetical protein
MKARYVERLNSLLFSINWIVVKTRSIQERSFIKPFYSYLKILSAILCNLCDIHHHHHWLDSPT